MLNDGDSDEKHTCCLQKVGRKTRKQLQYTVMIQGHKKSWNTEGCSEHNSWHKKKKEILISFLINFHLICLISFHIHILKTTVVQLKKKNESSLLLLY